MKRIFTFGLMLTAVFALTNCTEELVDTTVPSDEVTQETVTPEEEGIPFQVYASLGAETKTVGEISTDGKLKTKWVVGDKISVFYAAIDKDGKEGDIIKATGSFTIKTEEDVPNGKFSGFLPESFVTTGTYNWYFVYDASNGNINNEGKDIVVKMGTPSITLDGADNTTHIGAQSNCLMMGSALNLSGVIAPRVQMKHSSALLALRVINQGDAPDNNLSGNKDKDNPEQNITISSLTFSIPEVNTTNAKKEPVTQTPFQIVGDFKTNLTGDSYTPESNNSSSVTISLSTPETIAPGTYKTFYIPIRPFNKGDINRSNNTGPIFEVSLNGSYRKIEIAADKANLQAGTVSTLRVPVKLSYPKTTNAGSLVKISDETVKGHINGETVDIYTANSSNNIKIHALISDIIKAAPAGFYAATLKSSPSAMTVRKIDLEYPKTSDKYETFLKYGPFENELSDQVIGTPYLGWALGQILGFIFPDGIARDSGMLSLTKFIDPRTITFNGVLNVNGDNWDENIIILDEEPIQKRIEDYTIDNLLKTKFVYTRGDDKDYKPESLYFTVNKNTLTPSFKGLLAIVTENPASYGQYSEDARETAEALYYQLHYVIDSKVGSTMSADLPIVGTKELQVHKILDSIFASPEQLTNVLRTWKCIIEIQTYPYFSNKDQYVNDPKADKMTTKSSLKDNNDNPIYGNPMYFWGINVKTR